jgi:FAD/FMN-containing dehydrogenase
LPDAIVNFGGNLRFTPRHFYAPATEAEVLDILNRHAQGKVRVIGALHSWSPAVVCADAIVDLRHFDSVTVERDADGNVWATVGGGCRIKHLLRKLHGLGDVTLPTIGLITEQTIAGAIATATHGSGRHSLSHYMAELRVAAYDPATGTACIYTWSDGVELLAARCAVGCMGIVLSVRFRCVPRYEVEETMVPCATLDEVLAGETDYPLQQFYLVPHLWTYFVQRRREAVGFQRRRRLSANLYRAWWFVSIDVGLHAVLKLLASVVQSPAAIRFFYRRVLPRLILTNTTVVDHADRMLVMEHELFKHLEIEIFVPAKHLRAATAFVQDVLRAFDGTAPPADPELAPYHGTFTHHYPVTFRRVLPDDALIAMTGGADEPYYAISFITYVEPRDAFYALAGYLARSMVERFQARLHWGKYFPLTDAEAASAYPRLGEFRAICQRVDPNGVFRNERMGF